MTFNNSPNQIAAADIGSSLISERGYDSDAQYITTPKQTGNFKEPRSRPGVWREMSPLGQPNYDTDQETQFAKSPVSMNEVGRMGNNHHGAHREVERSPASWHSRSQPRWGPPQSFSTPRNAYNEHHRRRMGSSCQSMASSVSLDSALDGSRSATQGFYYPRHRQGMHNASMPTNYPRDNRHYSPVNNGGQSLNLPNCTPTFSQPYTTSAESVLYPNSQISVMKRRQRRQREQGSDGQSIHLVDMNIPRALASHSISPRVLSQDQSPDQNRWSNRSEEISITRPCHEYPDVEMPKTSTAHNAGKTSKEASSSYSRKTSISSDFPGYRWETKAFNNSSNSPEKASIGSGFDITPNRRQSPRPREVHVGQSSDRGPLSPRDHSRTDITDTQRGKFIGQPGSNRSISSPIPKSNCGSGESPASPRKVSVGWMSGGRRLGYGYTMVPADESVERPSHGSPATPKRTDSRPGSEGAHAGHKKQCSEKTSKISLRIGDSIYDISSLIQRLNPRHRAQTSIEITNRSDTASCDSVTSSLWEKLGYRKRSQNELDTDTDKKTPWGHFCGVGLDQTPREPPVLNKDASASVGSEDRGRLGLSRTKTILAKGPVGSEDRGRLGLSRAKTILAKGRGVGAIARELEHSIAQSKGTQAMKYKIRDLRNRRQKTDDDRPIISDSRKDSHGTSRDGEERDSNSDMNEVCRDEAEEPQPPSFDLVSDDWVDKIHECLDIQPIPE